MNRGITPAILKSIKSKANYLFTLAHICKLLNIHPVLVSCSQHGSPLTKTSLAAYSGGGA